jgi:membrane fusion protein, multidrug efflux system
VVNVALTVNNNVGIDNGLNPGEVVVTDGQDKLQEGSKVDQRTATGERVAAGPAQTQGGAAAKPQSSATRNPNSGKNP